MSHAKAQLVEGDDAAFLAHVARTGGGTGLRRRNGAWSINDRKAAGIRVRPGEKFTVQWPEGVSLEWTAKAERVYTPGRRVARGERAGAGRAPRDHRVVYGDRPLSAAR